MHPDTPTVTVADVPDPLPDDLSVLDVREPDEWVHGHVEGSLHVPLMELHARLDEVPDGRVLVVCTIGGRSRQAVDFLVRTGHDAVNLQGGLLEWAAAGRPLQSDTGRPPQVV